MQERGQNVPAAVKALFARKLLKKVAEAYGRMLLIKGLFQADCHPGNILIRDDNGLGMYTDPSQGVNTLQKRGWCNLPNKSHSLQALC